MKIWQSKLKSPMAIDLLIYDQTQKNKRAGNGRFENKT